VSTAHFLSHFYILMLPPLFMFVRAEYDVSYVELGFALTAFNFATVALQTPAGFLVDRTSPRFVLIGGTLVGAAAFAVAALVSSFWVLVAMFALAGAANAVYHPANYNLLSQHVSAERIGQAFSVHTFCGMLGSAVAPPSLLFLQGHFGWRGAFIGAALLGVAVAGLLAIQPDVPHRSAAKSRRNAGAPAADTSWRLLLSWPVLLNLIFFVLFSVSGAGIQGYLLVALDALYGTPLVVANATLTGFLFMSALGVLAGGWAVTHTQRYGLIATQGFAALGLAMLLVSFFDLPAPLLIGALTVAGFLFGATMPPRDMLVREVTPPGAFGKVFGFVTTGFNIGGVFAPLIFGALMDHGAPRGVFLLVAAASLLSIATLTNIRRAPR
jgi:MFS family permease